MPAVFDAPVAEAAGRDGHFGFLVPRGQPSDDAADFPAGDDPTVLVGLGATYAHQDEILEAIIGTLANLAVRGLVTTAGQVDPGALPQPPNVTVADYVPHSLVLDHTDVLVTHAGLGSVAGAMAFGVPLVCMPGAARSAPRRAARGGARRGRCARCNGAFGDRGHDRARAVRRELSQRGSRAYVGGRREGGPDAAAVELEGLLA